jgi:hypothetical protein
MSNASSHDLVPGMTGKLDIITRWLTVRDRRPRSPFQTGSRRRLIAVGTWAILMSGGVGAQVAIAQTTNKSTSCAARYGKIAWSAPIPASDVGKSLAASQFYMAWKPDAAQGIDHFDIVKAPDGSPSLRVTFPPVYGLYSFKGKTFEAKPLQTACFSFKMWIASNYWTGLRTNEQGHVGHKMPGMWGGPRIYHPPCSLRSEVLAAGGGFAVSSSMLNTGKIGLYYYDYSKLNYDGCGTGSGWGGAPKPASGRWHQYDLEVVMNNNGSRTGIARLYANGALGAEHVAAVWEPVGKTWGIMGLSVQTGNKNLPNRINTSYWYFKNFVVYTND